MNDQPIIPQAATPTPMPPFPTGGGNGFGAKPRTSLLPIVLIVVLGLGTLTFGILAISYYSTAQTAKNTVEAQKTSAAAAAKKEQKAADDAAYTIANESPFRSYVAPVQYGSFEIKFPKNWSASADQEPSGTQVNLIINPDFIRRTNGNDELMAARITLQERTKDQYTQSLNALVKNGKLKQSNIIISGQNSLDFTGQFADKKTTRQVVVPVRDKVLVFINENSKYAAEFNQILAQAKIVP